MIDSIIIVAKTLVKYLYGPNTNDVIDFEKKKRSHSIVEIIEYNDENLQNIKSVKDFKIRFDYMNDYVHEAFQLLENARIIIKKYNIPNRISIFDESGNISKIIKKEFGIQ